jgi:hypothetical protein
MVEFGKNCDFGKLLAPARRRLIERAQHQPHYPETDEFIQRRGIHHTWTVLVVPVAKM